MPTSGAFWMHDDRMDEEEFAASGCAPCSAFYLKTTLFHSHYLCCALLPKDGCSFLVALVFFTHSHVVGELRPVPQGCCPPVSLVHNSSNGISRTLSLLYELLARNSGSVHRGAGEERSNRRRSSLTLKQAMTCGSMTDLGCWICPQKKMTTG